MFTLEKKDDFHVVKANVNILDAKLTDSIRLTINDQMNQGRHFAIDLSTVKLIDSGGIAKLVLLIKQLKANGATLALVGLNGSVKSTFAMTRMDKVFPICESTDDLKTLIG